MKNRLKKAIFVQIVELSKSYRLVHLTAPLCCLRVDRPLIRPPIDPQPTSTHLNQVTNFSTFLHVFRRNFFLIFCHFQFTIEIITVKNTFFGSKPHLKKNLQGTVTSLGSTFPSNTFIDFETS